VLATGGLPIEGEELADLFVVVAAGDTRFGGFGCRPETDEEALAFAGIEDVAAFVAGLLADGGKDEVREALESFVDADADEIDVECGDTGEHGVLLQCDPDAVRGGSTEAYGGVAGAMPEGSIGGERRGRSASGVAETGAVAGGVAVYRAGGLAWLASVRRFRKEVLALIDKEC